MNRIALPILAAVLMLTGCKTTPDGTVIDVERVARVTREAAALGTTEALREHPEWRPSFQLAHAELLALEQSETIGIENLLAIVRRLPVRELKSDEARIVIASATILISGIDVPTIPADAMATLKPIVSALRQGIEDGGGS